jgi:hypothetical protein
MFIYKSKGNYLGFIDESNVFSRDGDFLGWVEGTHVWDKSGTYRGELEEIGGNKYILKNQYAVQPLPKSPKQVSHSAKLPDPPANITPVEIPIGYVDAY